MLAAGLVLGSSIPCDARPETSGPPTESLFAVLGGPVLDGLAACDEGQVPGEPSPAPSPNLPPRTERGANEHDCAAQGCWAWVGWNDRRPVRGAGAKLSIEAPAITGRITRSPRWRSSGAAPSTRSSRSAGRLRHTVTATRGHASSSTGGWGEGPAPDPAGSSGGAGACGRECRWRAGEGRSSRWAGFFVKAGSGRGRMVNGSGHSSSTRRIRRVSPRSRSGSARSSSCGRRRGPRWATASRPMPQAPHGSPRSATCRKTQQPARFGRSASRG